MGYEKHKESSDHALGALPREDLDLIVEFVLQSGSIKDLAAAYGVTYPTIRLRLDKVVERLRAAVDGRQPDPLKELLALLVERGEISISGARSIRDLVQSLQRREPEQGLSQKGGDS
ncbi:MAG TPA: DUF2089 family protein [Phycisphaerae bacterium]|nr:DUF2089 family protein [Phycisphaerae bacterium]